MLNRPQLRALSYLPSLALFLLANQSGFDVVHVHSARLHINLAVLVGLLTRTPVHVKALGRGVNRENEIMRRARSAAQCLGVRMASSVQAQSAEIVCDLRGIGVPRERIARIPNGVNLSVFSGIAGLPRAVLRERLRLPQDRLLDLLEVWEGGLAQRAVLVLVGSSSVTGSLGALPPTQGVVIRGWTAAISEYFAAADAFVLPSYGDSMSNALLEAMALGLPVVATRVGAAEEMIQDGQNGLLVSPGRLDELARALMQVIDDGALRERLGSAPRKSIEERYSIESVVDRVERMYEGMTESAMRA
jgi:glycosyltransferase involved in cell wall biosynthesis